MDTRARCFAHRQQTRQCRLASLIGDNAEQVQKTALAARAAIGIKD